MAIPTLAIHNGVKVFVKSHSTKYQESSFEIELKLSDKNS